MNIEPGFVYEFGASILAAMAELSSIEPPEGFSVGSMNLKFEFNETYVPAEVHGEWIVTIAKADAENSTDQEPFEAGYKAAMQFARDEGFHHTFNELDISVQAGNAWLNWTNANADIGDEESGAGFCDSCKLSNRDCCCKDYLSNG